MEMKLPTAEQLSEIYQRDLSVSFPSSELKPLSEMQYEMEKGEYRPWCLFDGDEIVGEAFVWTHTPGYALFDYLCVTPARRNDGLGSLLIQKLVEAERGNVVFGESEIPQYAPDPAMAERRLAFYRRNGAKQAGYDSCEFGVPYHTLYWSDAPADDAAMRAAHAASYRSAFPEEVFKTSILIPWDISMGIPTRTPWYGQEEL